MSLFFPSFCYFIHAVPKTYHKKYGHPGDKIAIMSILHSHPSLYKIYLLNFALFKP